MIGGTPFSTVPSGGIWNLCSLCPPAVASTDFQIPPGGTAEKGWYWRRWGEGGRERKERREERGEVRR